MCRRFVPAQAPSPIFEGGGAKGIAHVGAYAAADEMRFEFVGVAGASAGAIVASLIAVGFKPNECVCLPVRRLDAYRTASGNTHFIDERCCRN